MKRSSFFSPDSIKYHYDFIENPIYLSFGYDRVKILLGITNNIWLNRLYEFPQNIYSISFAGGLSFKFSKNFDVKLWYNREITPHSHIVIEPNTQNMYFKSYILTVYYKF